MAVAAAAAAPVASAAARGRRVGGRLRSGVRGRGRHRLPSRLPPLPRGFASHSREIKGCAGFPINSTFGCRRGMAPSPCYAHPHATPQL